MGVLADLVLVLHGIFIAFVVLGGFAVLRWPMVAWLHLPALAWGIWIELSGGICPLTPLEVSLRQRAGEAGYEGGFIEHYLLPLIYPIELDRSLQLKLAALLALINLLAYGAVIVRFTRRSRPL